METIAAGELAQQLQAFIREAPESAHEGMIAVANLVAKRKWDCVLAKLYELGAEDMKVLVRAGKVFCKIAHWVVAQPDNRIIVDRLLVEAEMRNYEPIALMMENGARVIAQQASLDQSVIDRLVHYAAVNGIPELAEDLEARGVCVSPHEQREIEGRLEGAWNLLERNLKMVLSHAAIWEALRCKNLMKSTCSDVQSNTPGKFPGL